MTEEYQTILKDCLEERMRHNPLYSLRSFARDLSMAPSSLSEVLKGKKGLSAKRASFIAEALRLPDWQANHFKALVVRKHARRLTDRERAEQELAENRDTVQLQVLKGEVAQALTSTLDLAILECTHLESFKPDEDWIAEAMNVSVNAVVESRERLVRAGLLTVDEWEWQDLSPYFSSTDGISAEWIKKFHTDVLHKMEDRLHDSGVDDRTMKSVVLSVNEDQMTEAKQILDQAIAKIAKLGARRVSGRKHVVCFSSQLFFLLKGEV